MTPGQQTQDQQDWSERDRRDHACWFGAALRLGSGSEVHAALQEIHAVRAAKEICCGRAREVLCSAHMSRCTSMDDNEEWSEFCWPTEAGTRAARKVAECCEGDYVTIQQAKAPLWMLREVQEDFAFWAGRRVAREQLDRAERDFGHQLCRLRAVRGRLHVGATPACAPTMFGPPIVRDIVAAVETLLGAGLLRRDVDFLVLARDFEAALPQDVPVFAQGAARCQRGVILVPLNDCLGGLVERSYPADPSEQRIWRGSRQLIWRGVLRPFTTCAPPPADGSEGGCACQQHDPYANASELPRAPRYRLLEASLRHPSEVLATSKIKDELLPLVPPGLGRGHDGSIEDYDVDWGHYLFHASVDATAYNTLGNWRPLLLGRVLVRQSSHVRVAWFRRGLRPFVHYIPVHFGMGDLRSKLAWARRSLNETERIRRRGLAFGRRYLSRCRLFAKLHILAALERYAEMQDW